MGSLQTQSLLWHQATDTKIPDNWLVMGQGGQLSISAEQLVSCASGKNRVELCGKPANLRRLDFRYTCEQHEGMDGYGWDEYDVRNGGRQTIHDSGNQIDLQTEFVKVPGGTHGGSWAVRIRGTPREDAPSDLKSTVIFAVALDGSGSLDVASGGDTLGYDGTVELQGNSPELGEFSVSVTQGPTSNSHPIHKHPSYKDKPLDKTLVQSYQLPGEALWQMKGTSTPKRLAVVGCH